MLHFSAVSHSVPPWFVYVACESGLWHSYHHYYNASRVNFICSLQRLTMPSHFYEATSRDASDAVFMLRCSFGWIILVPLAACYITYRWGCCERSDRGDSQCFCGVRPAAEHFGPKPAITARLVDQRTGRGAEKSQLNKEEDMRKKDVKSLVFSIIHYSNHTKEFLILKCISQGNVVTFTSLTKSYRSIFDLKSYQFLKGKVSASLTGLI